MELRRSKGRWRRERLVSTTAACRLLSVSICFSALIACVGCRTACLETENSSCRRTDSYIQGPPESMRGEGEEEAARQRSTIATARRYLGGPGSYPPRCTSKCGDCTPCSPVHVPVPRGTPVITEYYPEAWRCKCGNKLYMP